MSETSENPTPRTIGFDTATGKVIDLALQEGLLNKGMAAIAIGPAAVYDTTRLAIEKVLKPLGEKSLSLTQNAVPWAWGKAKYITTAPNAIGKTMLYSGLQTAEIGLNTAYNTAAIPYRLAASLGNSIRGIVTLNPREGFKAAAQNIRDIYTPFLKNVELMVGVGKNTVLRPIDVVGVNTLELFGFKETAEKFHGFMSKVATTSIFRNMTGVLDEDKIKLKKHWENTSA